MSIPHVLLLSLEKEDFFDDMYAGLLAALRAKARVSEALTVQDATALLKSISFAAVLVTDPAITDKKRHPVCFRLLEYASAGGTVVIAGHFSGFVHIDKIDPFFRDVWGLPWTRGSYHSDEFPLNPKTHPGFKNNPKMPKSYSMKAVALKGVKAKDIVYKSTYQKDQAPVALTQIGNGFFGYVGDVNNEEDMISVVLALCGL